MGPEFLFTVVLESKYMYRRLTLNASVADGFDKVARGHCGASIGSQWQVIGEGGPSSPHGSKGL